MFFDYHVHTIFSDDSEYPMEDVVKDAIAKGIEEIVFTDHVDYGIKFDWDDPNATPKYYKGHPVMNVDYPPYFVEIERLQALYQGKIRIKKGLEFGIQSHRIPQFEALFSKYPMDFVLLSIHQVGDKEFWTGTFQEGKTNEQSYDDYYAEMYKIVQNFHNYSVLSHMDLLRRYVDTENDYFEYCKADIQKILEYIIADGKGIEVNTSSFHYKLNGLTPSIDILRLYHELGGTIITVGSDTHKPEQLGAHIEEIYEILKEIGYTHICTFDKMQPIYHTL